jgi:hypothetical protein
VASQFLRSLKLQNEFSRSPTHARIIPKSALAGLLFIESSTMTARKGRWSWTAQEVQLRVSS